MDRIKVLIADDIEETRTVVKRILNMEEELFQVVGEASNGEQVINTISKVKPDVVLMDINMPILNGLEATEVISREYPSVIVIIMSVQGENEYLKKAMFHGAKEYIIKPFNYDVLIETIKNTYERNKEIAVKPLNSEVNRNGKIITFFSSKGGVGKSVLAVNSAVTFSTLRKKKTLMIDMDLLFGDISMLVNQFKEKTMLDLIDDGMLDSYESIKNYLFEYNSDLHILFGPKKPEAAEYIGKESIEKLLKILRSHYDIILLDTAVNFNDNTLHLLDISENILFVSTMDMAALKNTKLGLAVMQSLGYDKNKVKLIINRYNTGYGISRGEIEEAFKDGIFAIIPEEDKIVNLSINEGEPFCSNSKHHKQKIVKAIEAMCSNF